MILLLPADLFSQDVSIANLQAAFIGKFISFTEKEGFKENKIRICVESFKGSPVKEDFGDLDEFPVPVEFVYYNRKAIVADCSIIVSDKHLEPDALSLRSLKITLNEASCGADSHIRFLLENNKLRFAINSEKAKKDGFSLSSKLLGLAIIENC